MAKQWLSVGEIAERSGFAASAVRYYDREGLLHPERTEGNQRRFQREDLRRLAFISAAQHVGLTLEEIKEALGRLPGDRTPTKKDWTAISRAWRSRLDDEIAALEALRDRLDGCIGCGCLSLQACRLFNPDDELAAEGPGANKLPEPLHPPVAGAST